MLKQPPVETDSREPFGEIPQVNGGHFRTNISSEHGTQNGNIYTDLADQSIRIHFFTFR